MESLNGSIADGVSATGGVSQSFGGVAESSTMSHAPQTNVSHYVSSVVLELVL